jgi:hypothetical protein
MHKVTYIIWKHQRHGSISDYKEVVGLFTGTYEEADALIDKLDAADPSVIDSFGGRKLYGHFRTEPPAITARNLHEFVS